MMEPPAVPYDGILLNRIDNEDGTHALLVDHVCVATVPANDTAISHAVMMTCCRLEQEKRFGADPPEGWDDWGPTSEEETK